MFSLPIEENVSLARFTTFKIGGPAKYFFTVKNEEDLNKIISEAKQQHIEYFILGNGSDILVSDQGYDGLVIKMELNDIKQEAENIVCGSGVKIASLLSFSKEQELTGLEFLSGIPATVGGATWANAGSRDQNISQFIDNVKILTENAELKSLSKAECNFIYRDSVFKHNENAILEVIFKLTKADKQSIEAKMKEHIDKKLATQDLESPSVGSIFKNPSGEQRAWELIEEVGMRGYKLGGAQVSEKHANFIINTGAATASDVIMLISMIKQKVRDNLGVQLMEEIEYVGF